MSDRDRKRAFAACVAVMAVVVVVLSLLERGGSGGGESGAAGPLVVASPAREPAATGSTGSAGSTSSAGSTGDTSSTPDAPSTTDASSPPATPDTTTTTSTTTATGVWPAGQTPEPDTAGGVASAGPPAPPAVRAVAVRFVHAYLVYELGRAAPAARAQIAATSGGALHDQLLDDPPRAPLGAPLTQGHLTSVDGIAASVPGRAPNRFDVTYTVRRGDTRELHAVEVSRSEGRWLVSNLIG